MPPTLRHARMDELPELSELCLRSKAVWGYDRHFLDACRSELTLTPEDLRATAVMVAMDGDRRAGVVQVEIVGDEASLLKLFVEPARIKRGIGRTLFSWAVEYAKQQTATRLVFGADPQAAPFYRRMGAKVAGSVPSESIPGRSLPKLVFELGPEGLQSAFRPD